MGYRAMYHAEWDYNIEVLTEELGADLTAFVNWFHTDDRNCMWYEMDLREAQPFIDEFKALNE